MLGSMRLLSFSLSSRSGWIRSPVLLWNAAKRHGADERNHPGQDQGQGGRGRFWFFDLFPFSVVHNFLLRRWVYTRVYVCMYACFRCVVSRGLLYFTRQAGFCFLSLQLTVVEV